MGRRYLTSDEVQTVLNLGKSVECLIGRCERASVMGIRHCELRRRGRRDGGQPEFQLLVYESIDRGYFDDEAGPLDGALELGDASETHAFDSLALALLFLDHRWPGSSQRFVNQFMLADEYNDRLKLHTA